MAYPKYTNKKGFSLIEVLVVAGVMAVFFTGLFGSFRYTLALIADSKAKLTALTVANDEIEYIRSLSYDAVGTIAGIPPGSIPQVSTTTLNNIEFEKRVLVEYIDDPADGTGASDSNSITTDYKQAKVTVSWNSKGIDREVFLVSNIIPRSIETNVGGGTLRVNVFDFDVMPLPGASVRVVNNTVSPNIDVTRSTDSAGVALFGGAPAGPNYEIYVTAPGYSSDQTHFATTSLPNPNTQPVAVLEADISTMNFFIDRLSSLNIRTLSSVSESSLVESFTDLSGMQTVSSVTASSGQLILAETGGTYDSNGGAVLKELSPSPLTSWRNIVVSAVKPAGTDILVRLYFGTSTLTLIPDSELPGNSTGFSDSDISLEDLDVAGYGALAVGLSLSTSDTSVSPRVDEIKVNYRESEAFVPSVPLTLTGAKTIGTDASTTPIYKNKYSITTDGSGEHHLEDIEGDAYTIAASGYDIAEVCPANPVSIEPGTSEELDILLVSNSAHSLRVVAKTTAGAPISGAEVTLRRGGYSVTKTSSSCGQVFFGSLSSAPDYDIHIEAGGYADYDLSELSIAGDGVIEVSF